MVEQYGFQAIPWGNKGVPMPGKLFTEAAYLLTVKNFGNLLKLLRIFVYDDEFGTEFGHQ